MKKIMDIRLELGKRLRAIRKLQGLTQEKVAEQADINYQYYGEIERGLRNVTLRNLQKIAIGLDVSLGELFRFDTEKELDDEEEKLVAIVTLLLEKGTRRKKRMATAILKELI